MNPYLQAAVFASIMSAWGAVALWWESRRG